MPGKRSNSVKKKPKTGIGLPRRGAREKPIARTAACELPFLLLEEREILPVTLLGELVRGDEPQRRRVHAVALASRRRPVVEDMAQVRVGMCRPDLRAEESP